MLAASSARGNIDVRKPEGDPAFAEQVAVLEAGPSRALKAKDIKGKDEAGTWRFQRFKTETVPEMIVPVKFVLSGAANPPPAFQIRVTLRAVNDASCPPTPARLKKLALRRDERLPGAWDSGWFDVSLRPYENLCLVARYEVPEGLCRASRGGATIEFRRSALDAAPGAVRRPQSYFELELDDLYKAKTKFNSAKDAASDFERRLKEALESCESPWRFGRSQIFRFQDVPEEVRPPVAAAAKPAPRSEKRLGAPIETKPSTTPIHPVDADRRLANLLYFEALRDYGKGAPITAVTKLRRAARLAPEDTDIREALDRMRRETSGVGEAPADVRSLPSLADMQAAYELYFQALRRYSRGDMAGARAELRRASSLDPSDAGLAVALRRIERELSGSKP